MTDKNKFKSQLVSSSEQKTTRRKFLSNSALALTGAALANQFPFISTAKGKSGSANDTIGVAVIGCGSRGTDLLRTLVERYSTLNLHFPVVCDVWEPRRREAEALIESETGKRPGTTTRYSEVLESSEVDCVIIATPDFSHTPILLEAAQAGKHAYVEKPVSISIEQANQALDAVQESGIIFQAGTQFRQSPAFRGASRAIREGVIGELIKIDCWYNRTHIGWNRLEYDGVRGEDVDWDQFLVNLQPHPFDPVRFRRWQLYRDYTNGLLGLLGTHMFDLAAWLSDDPIPEAVVGLETNILGHEFEHADFQECIFRFPKGFMLHFSSRHGNSAPPLGLNLYGTKGTLRCPYSINADIIASGEGGSDPDSLQGSFSIEHEPGLDMMENWITNIRSGNVNTYADINAAYAHSVTAALGAEAILSGKQVHFNREQREISEG